MYFAIFSAISAALSLLVPTDVMYTLTLGSVPDGLTMAAPPPSSDYASTLDLGSLISVCSPVERSFLYELR